MRKAAFIFAAACCCMICAPVQAQAEPLTVQVTAGGEEGDAGQPEWRLLKKDGIIVRK